MTRQTALAASSGTRCRPGCGGCSRTRSRDADEDHADQEVAGDFLGPRGRVVERVAGEELVEDGDREDPEEKERDPGLEGVMREVDRRVGRCACAPSRRAHALPGARRAALVSVFACGSRVPRLLRHRVTAVVPARKRERPVDVRQRNRSVSKITDPRFRGDDASVCQARIACAARSWTDASLLSAESCPSPPWNNPSTRTSRFSGSRPGTISCRPR